MLTLRLVAGNMTTVFDGVQASLSATEIRARFRPWLSKIFLYSNGLIVKIKMR